MFVLTCDKTGRHWTHRTEGMARQAALTLWLQDYTIMPVARQKPNRAAAILAAVALSACTTQTLDQYTPVVDRPSARYDADLAQCRQLATAKEAEYKKRQEAEMGANIMAGLLVGALLGAAVGDSGDWAAYGAAQGAVAGAASTDTELAHGGPRRIIDRCMAERGHAVLSDMGRG